MTLPWYAYRMLGELGVEEWPGEDSNPRVLKYIDATPLGRWNRSDVVPWCGAFQSWAMQGANIRPPETGHRARSWIRWGVKAADPIGAVCVLKARRRATAKRTGSARGGYHVGTALGVSKSGVILVSGNVQDRVGVDYFPFRRWELKAFRVPPA